MSEIDLEVLGIFIDEALDALIEWERSCLNLDKAANEDDLNALFRAAHNIKGASKAVGLEALGNFVHQIENLITLVQKGKLVLNPVIINVLLKGQGMLVEWVTALKENPQHELKTSAFCSEINGALQGQNEDGPKPLVDDQLDSIGLEANSGPTSSAKTGHPSAVAKIAETIRISADKLGELIQLIGELSIHQSIVWHGQQSTTLTSERCTNAISLMTKVIKDIQSRAMSLRMQPLQGTFQRLERVAKDVARDLTKEINITVLGGDVDLDKTVTDRVTDPLIHIIRNAVDHGLEDSVERAAANKPIVSQLTISAEQDANGVLIKVTDDGRGIDPEKILKKAIEKNLAVSGDGLTKKEILSFIFRPGFSTAAKVTNISGRGVGLDVVRGAVDQLGGSVELDSELGKGTQFNISLPTSMAILDSIIIGVAGNRYVVPLRDVNEIIDLNSYDLTNTNKGGRMFSLRGNVVPIEPLNRYLPSVKKDLKGKTAGELSLEDFTNDHLKPALITLVDSKRIAFQVDTIIGQQQVVMRDLSENLSRIPGLIGGTILADGEPGMIIGLDTIGRAYLKTTGMENAA